MQLNLTVAIYIPWGNVFYEKITSIICNKHYVTYCQKHDPIRTRKPLLCIETKASSSDMEIHHQESFCEKSWQKFEASENFSVRDKLNYLYTHSVHQDSFTFSQKLFSSIQISSELLLSLLFHDFVSNVMKDCS